MCESIVYVKSGEGERLLAKDVVFMEFKDGSYIITDIAGNRIAVKNVEIEYIDFIGHKVILRETTY